MIPNSKAAWRNEASSNKTPYWRNGSASPRNADPMALMACSGEVLLKEARSDESFTKSIENLLKSLPLNPADFPNVANVAAASNACCFVWPSEDAAPSANFSMSSAVSPNKTPTFEIVSDKSDAALTASTPILIAIAPAAAATAAKASAAFLLKSPILPANPSTSFEPTLRLCLSLSTSARMESLSVLDLSAITTPSKS